MQNITRFALGLGAATVVASGGSAFTASNTDTAIANDKLGYTDISVTGVSITNAEYVLGATPGQLSMVRFTVTAAVPAGHQALLRTSEADGTTNAAQTTCTTPTALNPSTTTIECPSTALLDHVDKVHLTVTTTAP